MPDRSGKPKGRERGSARERSAAFRAAQRRSDRRRRTVTIVVVAIVAVLAIGGVVFAAVHDSSKSRHPSAARDSTASAQAAALGPEGMPLETGTVLAAASGAATGATVDGIQCNTNEQVAYHIHVHLAVYVNGSLRPIPPGVGIVLPVAQNTAKGQFFQASRCYYWLHVHAQDGVIHIEAPSTKTYSLGQFFAIWRQPLSTSQVASAKGTVIAYVDGKRFSGDPATIALTAHRAIQLDIGKDVAPATVDWSKSQL